MSKDNFWEDVIKLGIMLGTIWLGNEFLKSISNAKQCPNCKTLNPKDRTQCSNCGGHI